MSKHFNMKDKLKCIDDASEKKTQTRSPPEPKQISLSISEVLDGQLDSSLCSIQIYHPHLDDACQWSAAVDSVLVILYLVLQSIVQYHWPW